MDRDDDDRLTGDLTGVGHRYDTAMRATVKPKADTKKPSGTRPTGRTQ